jgi:hypothetical protein
VKLPMPHSNPVSTAWKVVSRHDDPKIWQADSLGIIAAFAAECPACLAMNCERLWS